MHDVHVPKEHLLIISFGRTPFGELVGKRAPVKDFCPSYTLKPTFPIKSGKYMVVET